MQLTGHRPLRTRVATLLAVALPPVVLVAVMLTGLGVTIGFHRLFSHGSFRTSTGLRATFAVLGSLALQGPVLGWVAEHRKHHAFSDREGDPHSPHAGRAGGAREQLSGLWHAPISRDVSYAGVQRMRRQFVGRLHGLLHADGRATRELLRQSIRRLQRPSSRVALLRGFPCC